MRIHAKHDLTLLLFIAFGCIGRGYAAEPAFYGWDVPPTAVTTLYERQDTPPGCEFECVSTTVKGMKSAYTRGVYGVDADGNGTRDGSLTGELEVVSEVSPTSGGQFLYKWQLRNLGTGTIISFVGSGPDFGISADNPLLGTAGPDRRVGTSDDLAVGQVATQTFLGGPPTIYASGIVYNPWTTFIGMHYAPASNPPMLLVTVDVKPGESPNRLNPKVNGNIPVAILTTSTLDAATVNPATVRFGPTGIEALAVKSALQDVDGDTHLDLILQFESGDAHIHCGSSSAMITGQAFSGPNIQGIDLVTPSRCN